MHELTDAIIHSSFQYNISLLLITLAGQNLYIACMIYNNYKWGENVFLQNQYRCRDGTTYQVAAWRNQMQLVENV